MNHSPEVIERHSTKRGDIQLQCRDGQYEIIYNGSFLMATYNGESERLLTRTPLRRCSHPHQVLIGGLGVGFTLAETLADPRVSQVDVVEIEDAVIDWNKRFFAPFNSSALEDARTRVIHADLVEWLKANEEKYDIICLDTDNGPDWTVSDSNSYIYSGDGLKKLQRMLTDGGILSFWSASFSDAFFSKLTAYFSHVDYEAVDQGKGEPDYVYIAGN